MRFPYTINVSTPKSYEFPSKIFKKINKISTDDFTWDKTFLKTLRECCLEAIKDSWKDYPFYKELILLRDKERLATILPCDLPLELTVPIVDDDYYWKRCFEFWWPSAPRPKRYISDIHQFYESSLPNLVPKKDKEEKEIQDLNNLEYSPTTEKSISDDKLINATKSNLDVSKNLLSEHESSSKGTSRKTSVSKSLSRKSSLLRNNSEKSSPKSVLSRIQSPKQSSKISSKSSSGEKTQSKSSIIKTKSEENEAEEYNNDKSSENDEHYEDDFQANFIEIPNLKSWKQCFLEKYFQEKLEQMEPTDFNQEIVCLNS